MSEGNGNATGTVKKNVQEDRPRLLGRTRYFHHHPLAQGELSGGRGRGRLHGRRTERGPFAVWRPRQKPPVPRSCTSWTCARSSRGTTSFPCSGQVPSTRASTSWAPPLRGPCRPRRRWKWPSRRARTRWRTDARARATTRCGSSWPTRPSHPSSPSSPRGGCGTSARAKRPSTTRRPTASTWAASRRRTSIRGT